MSGLNSTRADLSEPVALLRRHFEVVSFDLRGHGLSSAADRYSFERFRGDLGAVLEHFAPATPVLVGYGRCRSRSGTTSAIADMTARPLSS